MDPSEPLPESAPQIDAGVQAEMRAFVKKCDFEKGVSYDGDGFGRTPDKS